MAREEFIDSLRFASRLLSPPRASSSQSTQIDTHLGDHLNSADLWLTSRSVEGFDSADFLDWGKHEREELSKEVAAFLAIAKQVQPTKPATKIQGKQARKHLERIIEIVRHRLLPEWLAAQEEMIGEATAA